MKKTVALLALAITAGLAHAQWTTVGSNIYYSAGNVGVGVANPIFPIDARGNGARVISAYNTAHSGYVYGVVGNIVSSAGTGVWGFSGAQQGTGYGVYGLSNSDKGNGVVGYASSYTWRPTSGVFGKSRSTGGIGVLGLAESDTGMTRGVNGRVYSPDGYAGYFEGGRNYFEGNVGIGTTSPDARVTIGNIGGVDGVEMLGFGEGATSEMYFESLFSPTNADNAVSFSTSIGGTGAIMTWKASGDVGIGTDAPSGRLDVRTTDSLAIRAICEYASTGGAAVSAQVYGTNGDGVRGYSFATSGTGAGVVGASNSASGYDFYAVGAGTNYGAASSRRWKHDIVNIDKPLEKLGKLRGVYYTWNEDHGGQHDVGFIAEEVGEVLPEIVVYEENGIDASGMDYSKMTPLLVESVNALRAEKDAQLAQRDSTFASIRAAHETHLAQLRAEAAATRAESESLRSENHELRERLDRLESMMAELTRQ